MYELLRGVRVLEVAEWTFVPSAGAILADWGADVIKVEHSVRGDAQRGLWNALTPDGGPNPMLEVPNRGKRSIGIDLKHPRGQEVLAKLIQSADVFTTNMRAEARAHLDIDLSDVRRRNERVVYALGTGYGSNGPETGKRGFDAAATWSRSGMAYQMTPERGEPPPFPGSIGDLMGGLSLAGGIAAALYQRERGGTAPVVEVSLYAVGLWMMAQSVTAGPMGLSPLEGTRRRPRNPLVNDYRTKDGRWMHFVLNQFDRFWPDMCVHLGREDLIDDPRFSSASARRERVEECVEVLDEIFAEHTLDEWREILTTLEGVWDPVCSPREASRDPQAVANGYLPAVDIDDATSYAGVASPVQFDGSPVGALTRAPEHGEQTEEVLLELGYSWSDIAHLKEAGAVL